jgi:hypothetical protein
MSRSWKTMRSQRENPDRENNRRNGLRGIQIVSWQRPDLDMDDWLLSRDRYRDRLDRSRSRVGATSR